jgi:hypothetical protein
MFMIAEPQQYIGALLKIRDSGRLKNSKFLQMLQAQYSMTNHTITATQLARAVGFKNYNAANLQYGSLGHEVSNYIGYEPPRRNNGEPVWFWVLSSGNEAASDTMDSHYEFVMRPELVCALETMKWVK